MILAWPGRLLGGRATRYRGAMGKTQRWNDGEKAHLAAHYPAISAHRLTELIPDRSAVAIRNQASRMGIPKCHERLREQGQENVLKRWERRVFRTPEPPSQ